MAVIPTNGNDGHFSKTESNAVVGYMSVFTTVDYNPAGHEMAAKPKDDSRPRHHIVGIADIRCLASQP